MLDYKEPIFLGVREKIKIIRSNIRETVHRQREFCMICARPILRILDKIRHQSHTDFVITAPLPACRAVIQIVCRERPRVSRTSVSRNSNVSGMPLNFLAAIS